jgi:riboflavin kinase/FMN adenylyltransferase
MITLYDLDEIPQLPAPIALTIGMFDGVHLGHQKIFQELKKYRTSVVLTFNNHPAEVLRNQKPSLLCSLEEKLRRFEKCGIDYAVVVPFTLELAAQPYDTFLRALKKRLSFSTLVLGKGAAFGHKNRGNEEHVKLLEDELGFKAVYLDKQISNDQEISSKRIRELILSGQHEQASILLGNQL